MPSKAGYSISKLVRLFFTESHLTCRDRSVGSENGRHSSQYEARSWPGCDAKQCRLECIFLLGNLLSFQYYLPVS